MKEDTKIKEWVEKFGKRRQRRREGGKEETKDRRLTARLSVSLCFFKLLGSSFALFRFTLLFLPSSWFSPVPSLSFFYLVLSILFLSRSLPLLFVYRLFFLSFAPPTSSILLSSSCFCVRQSCPLSFSFLLPSRPSRLVDSASLSLFLIVHNPPLPSSRS